MLLFVLILASCSKEENDIDVVCTENCNTFTGQIKTVDNVGIPNVKLVLDYYIGTELGYYRRIIGKTTTDKNGFYQMSIFIKDNELGENSDGYFRLTLDSDKISNSLSEEYLKPNEYLAENSKPKAIYYSIPERNTTYVNDFVVPKKGFLKIKLNNFNPIIEGDYFKASLIFNFDFPNNNWTTYLPYDGIYGFANENPTILNVETALNGNTLIRITRRKNGVFENSQQELVLDNPNIYELEFEY